MGLLTPLAIRVGGIPWLPRLLPQIVWTDRLLQRVSRGRVSILDIAGLPNLTLTVVGRRSGLPRSTPLLCVPHEEPAEQDGRTRAASGACGGKAAQGRHGGSRRPRRTPPTLHRSSRSRADRAAGSVDRWLIAGSYFGGPDMPAWVHNLRAAGGATITWRRGRIAVVAREVEDSAERAELWQAMLRTWPNFAKYEERTDRLIPVFELSRLA
ncbi:hypothetical protein GCM10027062_31730 [Nocardioides hungaricus]